MVNYKVYKALKNQSFRIGEYEIVPIRYEDRFLIMKWRNEQIYHLRQSSPLKPTDQDYYFNNVVNKLFTQIQPDQILFSYLYNGDCIGYGGLVHMMPLYSVLFLIFTMANIALPGTSSFIGEFLLLSGIYKTNTIYLSD